MENAFYLNVSQTARDRINSRHGENIVIYRAYLFVDQWVRRSAYLLQKFLQLTATSLKYYNLPLAQKTSRRLIGLL